MQDSNDNGIRFTALTIIVEGLYEDAYLRFYSEVQVVKCFEEMKSDTALYLIIYGHENH